MKDWRFDTAVEILNEEITLVKTILNLQTELRKSVMERDWVLFEEKNQEISLLTARFARLEDDRALLFTALDNTNQKTFYQMVSVLPGQERSVISALYRELKLEVQKMRALNETFLSYLNEASSLAIACLEAACPSRGGKTYTRKGRVNSPDLRSIVVNNRF